MRKERRHSGKFFNFSFNRKGGVMRRTRMSRKVQLEEEKG